MEQDKELILPCECHGEFIKFSVFIEDKNEHYISYYTEYLHKYSLWERIKQVFKPKPFFEVVLSKESMIKLREYINETIN
jgi:hypothetical protein